MELGGVKKLAEIEAELVSSDAGELKLEVDFVYAGETVASDPPSLAGCLYADVDERDGAAEGPFSCSLGFSDVLAACLLRFLCAARR